MARAKGEKTGSASPAIPGSNGVLLPRHRIAPGATDPPLRGAMP